jgi:membrane-associated phospholipid phosphatase
MRAVGAPTLVATLAADSLVYALVLLTVYRLLRTRSIASVLLCSGHVLNVALSKALKVLLAQPRPVASCARLGTCGSMGMPSTHSQFMSFAFWSLYWHARGREEGRGEVRGEVRGRGRDRGTRSRPKRVLNGPRAVLCLVSLLVPILRVVSGHHSLGQVIVGWVLGGVLGVAWAAMDLRLRAVAAAAAGAVAAAAPAAVAVGGGRTSAAVRSSD